jgi:hypothetical protein
LTLRSKIIRSRLDLVPKLCLGTHPGALGLRFEWCDWRSLHAEAKQSFAEIRPQAELGNEVSLELRPRDF